MAIRGHFGSSCSKPFINCFSCLQFAPTAIAFAKLLWRPCPRCLTIHHLLQVVRLRPEVLLAVPLLSPLVNRLLWSVYLWPECVAILVGRISPLRRFRLLPLLSPLTSFLPQEVCQRPECVAILVDRTFPLRKFRFLPLLSPLINSLPQVVCQRPECVALALGRVFLLRGSRYLPLLSPLSNSLLRVVCQRPECVVLAMVRRLPQRRLRYQPPAVWRTQPPRLVRWFHHA